MQYATLTQSSSSRAGGDYCRGNLSSHSCNELNSIRLWYKTSHIVILFWLSVPTVLKGRSRRITSLHGRTVLSLCFSHSCHHPSPSSPLFFLSWLTPPLQRHLSLFPPRFLSFLCHRLMGFPKLFSLLSLPYFICWHSAGEDDGWNKRRP